MGHAAAAALIISQPLAVLAVVLLPPAVMARRTGSAVALVLWLTALGLLVAWGATTYRATVEANRTGTDGDLLGTAHWLGLALLAAIGSVIATRRAERILHGRR